MASMDSGFAKSWLAELEQASDAAHSATGVAASLSTLRLVSALHISRRTASSECETCGSTLDALTVVSKLSLFCTACDGEAKLVISITPDGFGGFTLQANLSGGNVHSTTNLSGNRNRIFDRVASLTVTRNPSEPGAFFQFRPGAVVV